MQKKQIQKDLFGKPVKQRRPRYEWTLEKLDKKILPVRAERIRWLESVIPRNQLLGLPTETYYVFIEAKSSFIYGCFVGSVILAAAFVEHWLAAQLSDRGFGKEANRGLLAMIKCCRKNNLVNSALLIRIDRLRVIRNPFVHLKEFGHKNSLVQRSFHYGLHPNEVLEKDAKESLITMYSVATYAFTNI